MKKIMFLLLAILGITAVAMAFDRAVEKEEYNKTVKKVAQQVWYPVDGPSEAPSVLEIQGTPHNEAPDSPSCNMENEGLPCAVHLEFPNNDAPTSVPSGTTVQDLINTYGASIVLDSNSDPEFTRKEIE